MASPGNGTLPNPMTPMAYFPPDLALKFTNQNYAAIGSLAVLLWDIILHLPQDFQLATRYKLNLSFIIYCLARLTTLTYFTGFVVVITAPVGNCDFVRQISLLYPFTVPLTVLPFVFRVFALYDYNKFIVGFFALSWLSVVGSSISVPIGAMGIGIGPTKYCQDIRSKLTTAIVVFCPFIHDSLIFVATSWALMRFSFTDSNIRNGVRVMVFGRHLPAFSKIILRDGQFYYLVTLILNLFFIVLFYIKGALITPCTIGYMVFVLLNTMSSYVYRNMRLGYYQDYSIHTSALPNVGQSTQHHGIVFQNSKNVTTEQGVGGVESEGGIGESNDISASTSVNEQEKVNLQV